MPCSARSLPSQHVSDITPRRGRAWPPSRAVRLAGVARHGPPPCRVTNVGEEMRVKEIWDRIEADYIEESQIQIPNPELGPLERRVGLTYEDALFSDDINVKDTEYWFTEPQGAPCLHLGLR